MRIALRHLSVSVAEQPLHAVEIHASLHERGGEGMPQVVKANVRHAYGLAGAPKGRRDHIRRHRFPVVGVLEKTEPLAKGLLSRWVDLYRLLNRR